MENQARFTKDALKSALEAGECDSQFTDFCLDSYEEGHAGELDTPHEFIAVCLDAYQDQSFEAVGG